MFDYNSKVYNTKSAKGVIPLLKELLKPKSVIDVGCGIGTWLNVFDSEGVDILGIDTNVNKSLLQIDADKFIEADLNKPFQISRKFDLVISLEVAEHLQETSADVFVDTLVNLGDTILFSAAIPGQGGQGHVNEQWPKYWIKKFLERGFICEDILRDKIWNNTSVEWWYKQNMFLFKRSEKVVNPQHKIISVVHPDNYLQKIKAIEQTNEGANGFKFAILLLIKTIKRKFSK